MNLLKRCCWVFLKFDFFLLHGLKCNSLPTSNMCFLQDQHITVQQAIPFTFSATCTHSITHKHIYTQEHTHTHTHTHTNTHTHTHSALYTLGLELCLEDSGGSSRTFSSSSFSSKTVHKRSIWDTGRP